jgi:hypothetical protein
MMPTVVRTQAGIRMALAKQHSPLSELSGHALLRRREAERRIEIERKHAKARDLAVTITRLLAQARALKATES